MPVMAFLTRSTSTSSVSSANSSGKLGRLLWPRYRCVRPEALWNSAGSQVSSLLFCRLRWRRAGSGGSAMEAILFLPSHSSRKFVSWPMAGLMPRSRLEPSSSNSSLGKWKTPSMSVILLLDRYSLSSFSNWQAFRDSLLLILLKDRSRTVRCWRCEMFSIFLTRFWYSSKCSRFTFVSRFSIFSTQFAMRQSFFSRAPAASRFSSFLMRAHWKCTSSSSGSYTWSTPIL
mmetsp:Transcript_70507/g.187431  ORF Transcript_70507/g.187431 Transcript_70507/m.187431 type:complete len:230 (-) Transcript_70507:54-743(-)